MADYETDKKAFREEVGRRVSLFRRMHDLTQIELGRKSGVSQSDISAVERGQRGLQSNHRAALAKALGIDPSMLDPIAVPEITAESLATGARSSTSDPGSRLPPGLEGYFERHPEVAKQKRIRWYLENQTFKAEPWVTFDDKFWGEMYEFWKRYLRELDEEGGAAGAAPAPGRRR